MSWDVEAAIVEVYVFGENINDRGGLFWGEFWGVKGDSFAFSTAHHFVEVFHAAGVVFTGPM